MAKTTSALAGCAGSPLRLPPCRVTAQIVHGPASCTVPTQNIGLKNEAIEPHINIQIAPKFSIIDFRALRFNLSRFSNHLNSMGGVTAAEGSLA